MLNLFHKNILYFFHIFYQYNIRYNISKKIYLKLIYTNIKKKLKILSIYFIIFIYIKNSIIIISIREFVKNYTIIRKEANWSLNCEVKENCLDNDIK